MTTICRKPVAVLLFACLCLSPAADSSAPAEDQQGKEALLKTVHSPQLKKIMRRLDMLAYESEYTALELESMRASQVRRLVEFAGELALTAEDLPRITGSALSPEDRITFRALARQLQDDTLKLKNESAENNYSNLKDGYQKLRQTCNSCHRLFRAAR